MSLASRAEDVVMWSSFFAFIMFLLAIASIVTMVGYLWDGTVEAWISVGACMVAMFLLLVLLCATTIPVAIGVAQVSRSRESLRALYIYLLLPVLFIGVMVGNSANYFLNIMIFGWPLFLVSGALMVIAAKWMRTEAQQLSFMVNCGFCKVNFDMMRKELVGVCPYCGSPNWNPRKPEDRQVAEAVMKAYQPSKPVASGAFDRRSSNPEKDLLVTVTMFLVVASVLTLAAGVLFLVDGWDWFERGLGLVLIGVGLFGLFASFMVSRRKSYLIAVVASILLLFLAFVAFLMLDVCGVVLGSFAVVAFFLSLQLWTSHKKGRKIRVPVGTVIDEAHVPPRDR